MNKRGWIISALVLLLLPSVAWAERPEIDCNTLPEDEMRRFYELSGEMSQAVDEQNFEEALSVAKKAMERAGVTPVVCPIRGGTDGARLSYEGLPCPNLFTGGYNFHGRYEYIPVEDMHKAAEVLLNLVDIYKDMPKKV